MAPEPEVLKRKRSRPSEWWAAASSPTHPQQSELVQKRLGKAWNRGILEAPAAGNRGKGKGKQHDNGEVDGDEDGEPLKPQKRGRPSVTMDELQGSGATLAEKENDKPVAGVVTNRAEIDTPAVSDRLLKKKRGRLSAGDEVKDRDAEPVVKENVIRKKRGRPTASQNALLGGSRALAAVRKASNEKQKGRSAGGGATDLAKPLRKGRSSITQDELEAAAESSANVRSMGKKPATGRLARESMEAHPVRRGRSSNTEAEVQAIFEEATRIRPDQMGQPSRCMEASEQLSKLSAREKDTRRTRRSDAGIEVPSPQTQTSTRGRRSDTVLEVQTAVSTFSKGRTKAKKRNERISPSDPESSKSLTQGPTKSKKTTQSTAGKTKSSVKGKNSKGTTKYDIASRKRKEVEDPKDNLQEVKRRRVEPLPTDEDKPSQSAKLPEYQHLTPVIQLVSHQTLKAKWKPLPQGCIELVSQFLSDIQGPVIVRLNDERKTNQANTALQMVSRKLLGKITKGLPFPAMKNHREDDFNFEKILDRNRALESQLTPTLHSNELLESELSKEIDLLESEQVALVELEANAKTEAIMRKQNGRKAHSLLQSEISIDGEDIFKGRIGLVNKNADVSLYLDISGSENIQAVFRELNGHMESIHGNIGQVKDVADAVVKSKAAVQATLFDHLDSSQYEGVVLG